jgi:hypothetical protein
MGYGEAQPVPKQKGHKARNTVLAVLAVLVILIGIAAATGDGKDKNSAGGATTTTTTAVPAIATTTAAQPSAGQSAQVAPPIATSPAAELPTTKATTPLKATKPAPKITKPKVTGPSFGDGTYEVGKDVPPGTYRTSGADGCYWDREKDLKGSLDSILANDNAAGQVVVTILTSDKAFKSENCGTWSKLPASGPKVTSFGDGKYAVGIDIAPGTYRTKGGDGCYWDREKNLTGGLDGLLANDNASGQALVTILATDKGVKTQNCGTWTKLPASGPKATSFGDGKYAVGIDIAPGTYRTKGGDGCYWDREKNLTGGLDGILANDNAVGPTVVTIQASDIGFKTDGCGTWSKR